MSKSAYIDTDELIKIITIEQDINKAWVSSKQIFDDLKSMHPTIRTYAKKKYNIIKDKLKTKIDLISLTNIANQNELNIVNNIYLFLQRLNEMAVDDTDKLLTIIHYKYHGKIPIKSKIPCPYGSACYRQGNPAHTEDYLHNGPSMAPPPPPTFLDIPLTRVTYGPVKSAKQSKRVTPFGGSRRKHKKTRRTRKYKHLKK